MAAEVTERFELVSEFEPQGDQPRAIEQLVRGVEAGLDVGEAHRAHLAVVLGEDHVGFQGPQGVPVHAVDGEAVAHDGRQLVGEGIARFDILDPKRDHRHVKAAGRVGGQAVGQGRGRCGRVVAHRGVR